MIEGDTPGTYEDFIPIKDTPTLMDPKEAVETTTLQDPGRTYIPGIRNSESSGRAFTANYDLDYVKAIEAIQDSIKKFSVWLGGQEAANGTVTPLGDKGKYNFEGYASYSVNEMEVNGVREMTITIFETKNMYRDKTGEV